MIRKCRGTVYLGGIYDLTREEIFEALEVGALTANAGKELVCFRPCEKKVLVIPARHASDLNS